MDARPDYSSTTSESEDQEPSPYPDTRFFLESDVPYPKTELGLTSQQASPQSKCPGLSILDKSNYDLPYADEATYFRCIQCVKLHNVCNRALPFCSRCTSDTECVYLNRDLGSYKNQAEAIAAYEKSNPPQKRAPSKSVTPFGQSAPSSASAGRPFADKLNAQPGPKTIEWMDGDISHSQKKCPTSIVKQINTYRSGFESSVAATMWPSTKTCLYDKGRALIFVDQQTDQEVPVARYVYGNITQFFVVWLPSKNVAGVSKPAIFKFKVFKNEAAVRRNGTNYKPVYWQTWVPKGVHRESRTIIRYIEDKTKPKWTPSQTLAGPLVAAANVDTEKSATQQRRHVPNNDWSSASDGDEDTPQRSTSLVGVKRAHNSSTLSNDAGARAKRLEPGGWATYPSLARDRGHRGWFKGPAFSPSRNSGQQHHESTRASTTLSLPLPNARSSSTYPMRQPTKRGPDVVCIFKDSLGNVCGDYDYGECDTAQKLFDVACVAGIAQIEPPATRLLNVQFDRGGEGRIRPDNDGDFERVFIGELTKLVGEGKNRELQVTISPYL